MTTGTLIDGARMYAAAADAVNDRYPNALHVLSHNLGMAIELALKAFLVHHGFAEKDLRRLGHDLPAIFKAATLRGLTYSGSRNFCLRVLGANYQERIFAYPTAGVLEVILPSRVRETAHEILVEVFIALKGPLERHGLNGAPGLTILSSYPDDLEPGAWAVKLPET